MGERGEIPHQGREEFLPIPLACRDAEEPGEGAVEPPVVEPRLRGRGLGLGEAEHVAACVVCVGWEAGPEETFQAN